MVKFSKKNKLRVLKQRNASSIFKTSVAPLPLIPGRYSTLTEDYPIMADPNPNPNYSMDL